MWRKDLLRNGSERRVSGLWIGFVKSRNIEDLGGGDKE